MKEILKKIVNFLKQSDKLKHCLVNLLVMLIAGSINIWLGIGLAAGKEYSKTLSIIKTAFEEIHLLFFYYHCKQKHYEASR